MFCPQCGQQQVTGVVRFCSRCGFPLDGVIQLLSSGGIIPAYRASDEPVQASPRKKGVKQGGLLFLAGILIVPILGMFASFSNSSFPQMLTMLAALICFVGGPLRMLYAALFEEGAPNPMRQYQQPVPSMLLLHNSRHRGKRRHCHRRPPVCPPAVGVDPTPPNWQIRRV
jgi:hypothetical protein